VVVESVPEVSMTNREYTYSELLERLFSLVREKNPYLTQRKKSLPPPNIARMGRKMWWSNFSQTCQILHRSSEHIMQFFLAELGTEGSIDGQDRFVFKGKYPAKQTETLLRKYIVEYVTCHMCHNPDTSLTRDVITRLCFVQCESCGSRRSVAPIKAGYHSVMQGDRRKIENAPES